MRILALFLLWLLAATSVPAQVDWSLVRYNTLDLSFLGKDLQEKNSTRGWVPIGIEHDPQGMQVLFLSNARVGAQSWRFEVYSSFEAFQRALTSGIEQGYTPVDASLGADRIYLLLLKLAEAPRNWAWVVSKIDGEQIRMRVGEWAERGYRPVGLTMAGDSLCILMILRAGPQPGWSLASYASPDALQSGLSAALGAGREPWGLIAGGAYTNLWLLAPATPVPSAQESEALVEKDPMTPEQIDRFIQDYVRKSPGGSR